VPPGVVEVAEVLVHAVDVEDRAGAATRGLHNGPHCGGGAAVMALDGRDLVRVLAEPRLAGRDALRRLHVELAGALSVVAAGLRVAVGVLQVAGAERLRVPRLAGADIDADGVKFDTLLTPDRSRHLLAVAVREMRVVHLVVMHRWSPERRPGHPTK